MEKKGFIFDNEISFLKSICNDDAMKIMQMQQTYYGQGEQEIEYVLRGAKLKCTHGNRYVHLDALEDYGIYSNGHAVMTCRECKPIENIADFRVCGNRYFKPEYSEEAPAPTETEIDENGEEGPKCAPTLMTGWIFINSVNMLIEHIHMNNKWEVLLKNSKAICVNGGVISIEENPELEPVEEEVLEWIPENVMQLDGSSEQEKNLAYRIENLHEQLKNKELEDGIDRSKYRWNQEKIDIVWQECRKFYDDFGVQLDPRLFLAIIFAEGTGSFDTSKENIAADGGHGPEENLDYDVTNAVDLVFGKVIAYPYYQADFSAARQQAVGLKGIPEYDDILHYINWFTPRMSTIKKEYRYCTYADANEWNRHVRQIYGELAFDGAAHDYTEFVLEEYKDKFVEISAQYNLKPPEIDFKALQEGRNGEGEKNGDYIIGDADPEHYPYNWRN